MTLLLIDDNPEEGALLRLALQRAAFPAALVHILHGEAALSWLETASPPPLAILCDVHMPGMDGFAVLEVLAQSPWRNVPVVFFTSDPSEHIRARAQETHARHLLQKPSGMTGYQEILLTLQPFFAP